MKEISRHALCAKQIRQVLKQNFPQVKFSVRADSFSGGSSVDVEWVDGPTSAQVGVFIEPFQYGNFNCQTDCYDYSNSRKDIAQVKYVQSSRKYSASALFAALNFCKVFYGGFDKVISLEDTTNMSSSWGYWGAREFIEHKLAKTDLTVAFVCFAD